MKVVLASCIAGIAVFASAICSSAQSAGLDPWLVLKKITHRRTYQIETRDHKCGAAAIREVSNDSLTAIAYVWSETSGKRVVFPRAEILSLKSGRHTYYSGRSSWLDVKSLRGRGRERLRIVTTAGKTYEVKPPYSVTDEGITLDSSGKAAKLKKNEIAQVYHVVEKPLSDTGEYFMDELGPLVVLDPDMWVYGLHLEPYVSVLLYDAQTPEDDSPASCAR